MGRAVVAFLAAVIAFGTPLLDDISPATVKREIRVRQMLRERVQAAVTACNVSPIAADLLMQMLQHDRHARPTIKEALKHPFNTDGYELERQLFSLERNQALEMLATLPDTVREVMQEPML
ncbi:CPK1, partial [Symbiodinium pilosum]